MPIINETVRVDICLEYSAIIVRIVARVFVTYIDQRSLRILKVIFWHITIDLWRICIYATLE